MKILKDILKYVVLLWLGTAILVLGFEVFLKIDIDLCIGILALIMTAIIAIYNRHNILQIFLDLVFSLIISVIVIWGLGFIWAIILEFGTNFLTGPAYLVVILTIAVIASICKNCKKESSK